MLPKPIFPPRPEGRLTWQHLPRYEESGEWVVQRKFNGKHVVIWANPQSREIGLWGREQEELQRFKLTGAHKEEILSLALDPSLTYWFAGELMHQKPTTIPSDPRYQGKIILFDVLAAGRLFVRRPDQMGRLSLLSDICRHPTAFEPGYGIALQVTQNVWMAETFPDQFVHHYQEKLDLKEIEGVMLRRRRGILGSLCTKYWETPDLIRVRKPHKLYTH